jgi:hypothetical protein
LALASRANLNKPSIKSKCGSQVRQRTRLEY